MIFGYARVSTKNQDDQAQIDSLEKYGCETVYHEKASGGRWDRPELKLMLSKLRTGDRVVVWKLDRLSRSLKDLLTILESIEKSGSQFTSITESIDTGSAAGKMMMQIVGSFAEFERAMLKERTFSGLKAARKEGRVGGRRPKLSSTQREEIASLVLSGKKTAADAARLFRVHPSTITRLLASKKYKSSM